MGENSKMTVEQKEIEGEAEVPGQSLLVSTRRKTSLLRSLTRLVIGGIAIGSSSFANNLRDWERRTDLKPEKLSESKPIIDLPGAQYENTDNSIRHALIGMVFETQDRIEDGVRSAGKISRYLGRITEPFWKPISASRAFAPARRFTDRLVERGEREVRNWTVIGREEEQRSRELAETALYETIDFWIDYFAENPEVVDLVTTQSVSLASEVVEEVRERTVSADNFLESIARSIFRRPQRKELPPPPEEVRTELIRYLQRRKKIKGGEGQ